MTISRTDKGTWRIRETIDHKTYSITVKQKPTQKEARRLLDDKIHTDRPKGSNYGFKIAGNAYIDSKRNILSPVTIRGYLGILNAMPEWFNETDINDITPLDIQRVINEVSAEHTPKTVRNYNGFISAVIKMFRPTFIMNTSLPQKIRHKDYIPSSYDIKRILDYSKDSGYWIVLYLGCMGLRRSEAIAITKEDVTDNNILIINKAMVPAAEGSGMVTKTTKTVDSTREIPIPSDLADAIRNSDKSYIGHPNDIVRYLHKVQDKLKIPRFTYHKLRHYFASQLSTLTDESTVLALGGWSPNGQVMKEIYRHSMTDEEKRIAIMEALNREINSPAKVPEN